jgi:hypothetical protein
MKSIPPNLSKDHPRKKFACFSIFDGQAKEKSQGTYAVGGD